MLKSAKVDLAPQFLDPNVSLPSANHKNFHSDHPNYEGRQHQYSLQRFSPPKIVPTSECLTLTLTLTVKSASEFGTSDLNLLQEIYVLTLNSTRYLRSHSESWDLSFSRPKQGNMAEDVDWAQ